MRYMFQYIWQPLQTSRCKSSFVNECQRGQGQYNFNSYKGNVHDTMTNMEYNLGVYLINYTSIL